MPGDGEDPWIKDGIYIATGLAKTDTNGELIILDEGHDYTFGELGSELYNWELESITVHPMLIDGVLTELTLIEDATSCPSGETCYTIKNKLYKVSGTNPTISAINHRRSNINIKKIVEGEKAADVLAPSSAQPNIEERKLEYLHKFIEDCKINNIQLIT